MSTPLDSLTPRETRVIGMVAEGHSNKVIARDLCIAEQTVKFHLTNIYRKLGVTNRTEAARASSFEWWRSVTGMDELQQAVEEHNARQIKLEIAQHLADAQHSIEQAYACLDDLTIYLPKVTEAA